MQFHARCLQNAIGHETTQLQVFPCLKCTDGWWRQNCTHHGWFSCSTCMFCCKVSSIQRTKTERKHTFDTHDYPSSWVTQIPRGHVQSLVKFPWAWDIPQSRTDVRRSYLRRWWTRASILKRPADTLTTLWQSVMWLFLSTRSATALRRTQCAIDLVRCLIHHLSSNSVII
jgi:hypothetical protein